MEHVEKVGNKVWDEKLIYYLSKGLGIDISEVVYKRVYGEEQTVQVNGKTYTLLPIGNINEHIQSLIEHPRHNRGTDSISAVMRIINEKLVPITIKDANMGPIMASYIEHYRKVLGEEWSDEDFVNKIKSLLYRTCKYARDEETGEIIVVGFFGGSIATAAVGKYLTNGELYVLPEFRGRGIATELVRQTLELAKEDGIEGFDSLTYKVPGHNSLQFWENIGANNTELYHIAGDINDMLNNLSNISENSKDDKPKTM